MMHCHSCGREITDNIDICMYCGSNLLDLEYLEMNIKTAKGEEDITLGQEEEKIKEEKPPEDLEGTAEKEEIEEIEEIEEVQEVERYNREMGEEFLTDETDSIDGLDYQDLCVKTAKDNEEQLYHDNNQNIAFDQQKDIGYISRKWSNLKTKAKGYVSTIKNNRIYERVKSNKYFITARQFINSNKSPKFYGVIVTLLIIMLLSIYGGYKITSINKIHKIVRLVEEGSVNEAVGVYNSIKLNSTIEKIDNILIQNMKDKVDDYINEKIDYHQIDQLLVSLAKFPRLESEVSNWRVVTNRYKNSRDSMKHALEFMGNKKYIEAIEMFKKVINDDKNYAMAQRNINLCIDGMYEDYKNQQQKLYDQGQFVQLYKIVKVLLIYKPQEKDLELRLDQYLSEIYADGVKRAQTLAKENQYDKAIGVLKEVMEYFPGDDETEDQIKKYELQKEQYLEQQRLAREKKKEELLANTNNYYNENLRAIVAVPKGQKPQHINVNMGLNIYPMIAVEKQSGIASICIIAGFEGANSINFNKITFELDNSRSFTWQVSDSNKHSQHFYDGSIAEWAVVSKLNRMSLLTEIEDIVNSVSVKMTFQGEGMINHVVTEKEKEDLAMFIELLGLYK